jgi:hypothetical protein
MRNKGMSESAISAALQAENLANCKPPLLTFDGVSAIATSVKEVRSRRPGQAAGSHHRHPVTLSDSVGCHWNQQCATCLHSRVVWLTIDARPWLTSWSWQRHPARTIHQEAAAIDNADDVAKRWQSTAKVSLRHPLKASASRAE